MNILNNVVSTARLFSNESLLVVPLTVIYAVGGGGVAAGAAVTYLVAKKIYQNCPCTAAAKRNFSKPNTISAQPLVPKTPFFAQDSHWGVFTDHFRKRLKSEEENTGRLHTFPRGFCGKFCDDLEGFLTNTYHGKCVNGKLMIKVDGKELVLSKKLATPEGTTGCHYYLVLSAGEEEWIVDPSWKQFAGKVEDSCVSIRAQNGLFKVAGSYESAPYCLNDAYNTKLDQEFPDILVVKREELFSLMGALSEETGDKRIQQNSKYWEKAYAQDCPPFEKAESCCMM